MDQSRRRGACPQDQSPCKRKRCALCGEFRVHEATIAAGAAIGRELQKAIQERFEGSVRVSFPDRAAFTLGAFVKSRLIPKPKSHPHTSIAVHQRQPRRGTRCRPRNNACCPLCQGQRRDAIAKSCQNGHKITDKRTTTTGATGGFAKHKVIVRMEPYFEPIA
jgi:hypothetical protein